MKKVFGAVLSLILLPSVALAQDPAPQPPPAEEPQAPAAAAEAPPAPEAAATATAAPAPTTTQVGVITSAITPEQMRSFRGFIHTFSLDHSVGTGTFVNPAYNADIGASFSANTTYSFGLANTALNASAGLNLSYEYSLPDNINGRRFNWSDIRLGLSAPAFLRNKLTGINITPSLGASIPLSLSSLHASNITTLNFGLGANRTFGEKLMLNARIGGSRGLQFNPANVQSRNDTRDLQGNLIYVCRDSELYCGSAGMNQAWGISGGVGASYGITEKLWTGASLSLSKTWRNAVTDELDDESSKALDSNGNRVVRAGMGQFDMMTGSLWASYQLNDQLSLDLSMGTASQPKTNDNRNFRFPFFDFVSPAGNLTSFSLGLSARL